MLMRSTRGIALVAVLLLSVLVVTVALGLSLILGTNHLAVRNAREATALAHAAAAGIELAAHALADADWQVVLAGAVQAPGVDGPPWGVKRLEDGDTIDAGAQTSLLNCGAASGCLVDQLRAVSPERPWGLNNPTWRLFLYGPLSRFAAFRHAPAAYVLVWVADDGREHDDDPEHDGGDDGSGGHILRLRSVAIARGQGRRGFEAEAIRVCRASSGTLACQPGIRVQSWRDIRWSVS